MSEAKSNTLLNQYLRKKRLYCYYELKVATAGRFSFSKIEEHQDQGLAALANEGLVWKLSDEDSRKKPCDGFCTPPLPAFLVIRFGDQFCFIEYHLIQGLRAGGSKSITEEQALELSTRVVNRGH